MRRLAALVAAMLSSNESEEVSTTSRMRGTVLRFEGGDATTCSASQFATALEPPKSLTKQQITLENKEKTW
jgi:hypothetical protein